MALVSEAGNGRVRNTTKTTGAKSDERTSIWKLLRRGHGEDNGMFCMIA